MPEEFSYDAVPYPSKFFLQTHPDRLAAAGVLYGMHPGGVESCRVLELGCGNGSNLISQAFGLPDSKFVGIDLSRIHIDQANAAVQELKLSNIEFRKTDLMEMLRVTLTIPRALFSAREEKRCIGAGHSLRMAVMVIDLSHPRKS